MELPGIGHDLLVDDANNKAYVSLPDQWQIAVIDLGTFELTSTVSASGMPYGISRTSGDVVTRIGAGLSVRQTATVTVDEIGGFAYVANSFNGVHRLDTKVAGVPILASRNVNAEDLTLDRTRGELFASSGAVLRTSDLQIKGRFPEVGPYMHSSATTESPC